MAEPSFEDLRRVQLAERSNPNLVPLADDFYSSCRVFLRKHRDVSQGDFSVEATSAIRNFERLLSEISRKRERKIFLKALADFQAGRIDSEGMAGEEKELYTSLVRIISGYESAFDSLLPQSQGEKGGKDLIEVVVTADLPQFVGSSDIPLGPFSANQRVKLPRQDAQLLLEQGAARTS